MAPCTPKQVHACDGSSPASRICSRRQRSRPILQQQQHHHHNHQHHQQDSSYILRSWTAPIEIDEKHFDTLNAVQKVHLLAQLLLSRRLAGLGGVRQALWPEASGLHAGVFETIGRIFGRVRAWLICLHVAVFGSIGRCLGSVQGLLSRGGWGGAGGT